MKLLLSTRSQGGGGGGSESKDNVDIDSCSGPPMSSGGGGGGNDIMESVIEDGIVSSGLKSVGVTDVCMFWNSGWCPSGVPGALGVGVDELELMLSIDPRLAVCRRFKVPLEVLSSLRRRLWRLVNVPPRSGDVGFESVDRRVVSPTSFSWRVFEVNGKFGFIDGLRLMVPVVNSESKPLLSSDKHPLELELEARDNRPLEAEL